MKTCYKAWTSVHCCIQKLLIKDTNLWVATIFCLARTHIRTLDFRPHAHRTHVCVLPKFDSHTHTHVYSKREILKQILHFLCTFFMHLIPFQAQSNKVGPWNSIESSLYCQKSPKLGLFYPKTCKKRAKLRSHVAHMKNGRTHAHFESLFARTLHTCERARACACANLISQLTACI